ncbi:MAG TPA: iron-sulfur cluster repair di-iron protein [Terriglobia bacterium]|nr:iron-sulfur cluster repair di-iron protein [Terriglobia bacterium]
MIVTANQTVKDLAVQSPGAARVFEELGIDYCCGGNISLNSACEKAGLKINDVLSSLEAAQRKPEPSADWSRAPLAALAQHIVERHHAFTTTETARLEGLFTKVCRAHGDRHPELAGMQATFTEMAAELRMHMMKEERILFPYLREMEQAVIQKCAIPQAMFGSIGNPVRAMMKEHDVAGESLRALRGSSSGYRVPEDACATYRELYRSLEAFEADMHTHVHLENNILFPRALEMEAAAAEGRLSE